MTRWEGPPTGSHVRFSPLTNHKSIYMNVAWKQEDFHRIIDQSSITEPDFDSINDALHVICDPGDVHEVRVPDTNLGVLAGWFDDLVAMTQAILDLTRGEGKYEGKYGFKALTRVPESVYVSLNPVSEDLLALVGNRIKVCDTTTKDHDIVAIKRLFLDGDPWRRKGISSTDEGHSLAISKMKEIRDYLIGHGVPSSLPGGQREWCPPDPRHAVGQHAR